MKMKVEGRKIVNIVYIIVIIAILFTNFFSSPLSKLLYLKPNYEFNNITEIHFINVGQGDAIGIKFDNGKTMLVDTGIEKYRKDLTYYLDNILLEKSNKIDYLLLTHVDTDHSGNMLHILSNYDIDVLYRPKISASCEESPSNNTTSLYDEIISTAISKNIELKYNEMGNSLVVGNNTLSWLSPIDIDNKIDVESNDYSPVIRLDYNNNSALLTGDISEDTESELINYYSSNMLDVDILKLAHHGSAYSNSSEFINITSPLFACVSVGENTYGHPANATLERILEYDKLNNSSLYNNLYSTKEDGNIIFTLKNDILVSTIANINEYSFVNYYIYSSIAVVILLIGLLTPYYNAYKNRRRFIRQNKLFEESKSSQDT